LLEQEITLAQFHNTYNGNSAPTKAEIAGAMGLPESDARVTDALDRKKPITTSFLAIQ
jgi:hypothetical protein